MRIKIVRADKDTYWYKNLIGREFQVTRSQQSKLLSVVELTKKELRIVKKEFPKEEMRFVSGLTISDGDYEMVKISKLEK